MNNFARVAHIALRYRLTVIASIFCSLGIAVLWAANFSALMPVVDGVMHGKAIPGLISSWIDDTNAQLAELDREIAACKEHLAAADSPATRAQLAGLLQDKKSNEQWLASYQWALPVAKKRLPSTPFGTLMGICLMIVISTILKGWLRVINSLLVSKLGHLTLLELRKQFYRRTMRLDLGTLRQTSNGDLMTRFTSDMEWICLGTQALYGMAIREPLKMIACLIGAAMISWQLLLITAICAPPAIYAIHWLAKSLKRANRRAMQELSSVYEHLEETFDGIKVIKAFTMESHERSRFHRISRQYYRRSMRIAFYDSLVSPTTELIGLMIIVGVVAAGGYLVLNQQTHLYGIRISSHPLSHGMLTAFYAMLAGIIEPSRRLSSVFNYLQRASASSDRIYELMDRETKLQLPLQPKKLPARLGPIHFNEVAFSYQPSELVLDNVSLSVDSGETIAIVGPNGCGKSTLMNLLPRFYDPNEGNVTIGGIDLRDMRLPDLRERIGVVTQETLLFDDTVANNIRYGSPGATMDQIIEAAQQAHAHRFVTSTLAEGYQTLCGPSGNRLSGGQRQRLALARAILRNPEILILDEATSQIDVESERLIHEVLERFIQGRTAFMITHRPNTLTLADRIVVMDAGRIVDVGTFDELALRCELFCRLAHLDIRASA
ncbi:ABC transporter ATP-binding protein [Bythopirellula polymerisocia]|uniref:Putative multidrug export ATP-binding/permease protein n=1 Tax=Bythopirellula polymerisocia TaxID=2528003 RepID=A0A5C6D2K0_9BACT|nr:ABC transporter ATP-binding protein [Bythopirellula polymerisocia]TWU30355.1 putative multidrug export ATP-binding/permease protein [Bythopirellula polymerisocia]